MEVNDNELTTGETAVIPATAIIPEDSSSKTSSSEDILPHMNMKRASRMEDGGCRPKKSATVSAVTEEARLVLEQFLKVTLSQDGSHMGDIMEESPYAMLVQEPGGTYKPAKIPAFVPIDRPSMDDDDGKNEFTDYEKIDDSPDYAECYDNPDGQGTHSISSQSSFGISLRGLENRSHSPCERALHAVHPVVKISQHQYPPRVKSKPKGKAKLKALFDSSSSSSTEDYEYPDVELLGRKKKSFFKWASERLRQSFRRESKKVLSTVKASQELLDSPLREEDLLPPVPDTPRHKKHKDKSKVKSSKRSSSDKSKSNSNSPPNQEVLSDGCVHVEGEDRLHGDELSRFSETELPVQTEPFAEAAQKKKSPLPWRRHELKKRDGDEKGERDNRGLFESLLHHIRKGSQKLKRKGSKERLKSRSADNLVIRPLSKENKEVLQRYIDPSRAGHGAESDLEQHTVRSIHEVSMHRVAGEGGLPPGLVGRGLPPPSPLLGEVEAALVRGGTGRHSLRRRMQLEGLVHCAPHLTPTHTAHPGGDLGAEYGHDDSMDVVDGPPELPILPDFGVSKPFHERTDSEKDALYERIAEQLAAIADHYNLESPHSPKSSNSSHSNPSEPELEKLGAAAPKIGHRKLRKAEIEKRLGQLLREKGDSANKSLPEPSPACVAELVRNASYSHFKQIVNDNISGEPGWQQVALMFRFTQTAVQLAGMGTAVALQIKEMTLKYFEDNIASWIVDQGGWESVVEDTNTELDSELD